MSIPAEAIPAATLQRIQELRADGLSLRQIASRLQYESTPPPTGRKGWNHMVVNQCLEHLPAASPLPPEPEPPDPPPKPEPPAPPTLTIKVTGPYTATDRRLWGFLLHRVWDELNTETTHTLPLPVVLGALRPGKAGPGSKQLEEAVERLAATHVKWVGKLGPRRRAVFAPLLSATVSEDTLSFHFPPDLVALVTIPQQYARLQAQLEGRRDKSA